MQGIPTSNIEGERGHYGSAEPFMGGKRAGCHGTGDCTIEHFFLEHKAHKKDKGWRTQEDNGALSKTAKRRQDSRSVHICFSAHCAC